MRRTILFFKKWIEINDELSSGNCEIVKYSEIPESREKVYEKLTKTVIKHYSEPKRITKYLNNEKFSKLERYINNRLPTVSNHEKGDFGEILGTEHLIQFHNYTFPILKLRHKPKPNRSLEGEDILGFYIENDEITRICVGESKVRSSSDSDVLDDALDQLDKSYHPHPVLLEFLSDRVYSIDEELAEKIEDLTSEEVFNNTLKDNWIFYITGFKPREFKIKPNELDNLVLVHIYLDDLNNFITTLFEDCRGYYHEE